MGMRKTSFAIDEYYHVYNRGNSKQKIFYDKKDYDHFLKLLYLCNSKNGFVSRDIGQDYLQFERKDTLVAIGAFCFMPNHFHILIREKEEGGIVKFMKKLSTAYVMYLNVRHKRTGGLFEGRFKSEHINNDRHLKYLFSYIHLNPVKLLDKDWEENGFKDKNKIRGYLKDYSHSSYQDYAGVGRVHSKILSKESFPKYFTQKEDFLKEVESWIKFTP